MPTAKRLKSSAGARATKTQATRAQAQVQTTDERPAAPDLDGGDHFSQVALKNWLKPSKRTTKVKVKKNVVKGDLWDALEKENFSYKSLLVLENLQTLERCVRGDERTCGCWT
jgi:intron-binding protein aquarius